MIIVKTAALREARIKAGLTGRAMSRKLGKSSSYISQVERGMISVSPQASRDICQLLDLPFEALFELDHSSSSQATRTA